MAYTTADGNPGGTSKKDKIIKKPGDTFPGFILCPYRPTRAAGITAGNLYAGLIKSQIQDHQQRGSYILRPDIIPGFLLYASIKLYKPRHGLFMLYGYIIILLRFARPGAF